MIKQSLKNDLEKSMKSEIGKNSSQLSFNLFFTIITKLI